jgi:hypothetical protein
LRVRTNWRGSGDTALVARLDSRGTPTLYAKVGLGASTADVGAREAAAVTALGPAAAAAGARVPHVRGQVQIAGRPAVFLSALEGRPVAQASRRKIEPSAGATSDWLRRFGRETHAQAAAQPVVETSVLRPSGLVVRGLDGGTAYVESLRQLAEALGDRSLTVTAAHGDLTLWNVLTGETPGILDWAGASETALPLVDLPYLLVDARYWRSLRRDRLQAFRECFPDGRMRIDEQLIGFDAPPPVLELAFHACWLGHAANERRQGIRGPFSEIVGALARKASP